MEFTQDELRIIVSSLKNEKEVIYQGSSYQEHDEYHQEIDTLIQKIRLLINP